MDNYILSNLTSSVNVNGIRCVEQNGEILFSSEEIGKQLGYADPAKAISNLFYRNQTELETYATILNLRNVHGKSYQVRHFTEVGMYLIVMRADTEKSKEARAAFAHVLQVVRKKQVEEACKKAVAEVQSKPAMLALRQEGKLEGIKEASNPRTDRLAKIRRAIGYLERGFTLAEAAKLVDMRRETLRENLILLGVRKGKKRYSHNKKRATTHTMPKGESHDQ